MSIADKLKTVADNVPKVYEAGRSVADKKPYVNTLGISMCYFFAKGERRSLIPYIDWSRSDMFQHCFYNDAVSTKIDMVSTPMAKWIGSMFYNATAVKEITGLTTNKAENIGYLCSGCTALETMCELDLSSAENYVSMFYDCKSLKNITFVEGSINVSISFQHSPLLTIESAKSIIKGLVNYAGTDTAYSYTVSFANETKELLVAEGATSPTDSTWIEYISELGWNS